jgi:hypothetical protein
MTRALKSLSDNGKIIGIVVLAIGGVLSFGGFVS